MKKKSMTYAEAMVWGACCLGAHREEILEWDSCIFSDEFSKKIELLKDSIEKKKLEQKVWEEFALNGIHLGTGEKMVDAVHRKFCQDLETKQLQDAAELCAMAARLQDRNGLVELMKKTLTDLGEI